MCPVSRRALQLTMRGAWCCVSKQTFQDYGKQAVKTVAVLFSRWGQIALKVQAPPAEAS